MESVISALGSLSVGAETPALSSDHSVLATELSQLELEAAAVPPLSANSAAVVDELVRGRLLRLLQQVVLLSPGQPENEGEEHQLVDESLRGAILAVLLPPNAASLRDVASAAAESIVRCTRDISTSTSRLLTADTAGIGGAVTPRAHPPLGDNNNAEAPAASVKSHSATTRAAAASTIAQTLVTHISTFRAGLLTICHTTASDSVPRAVPHAGSGGEEPSLVLGGGDHFAPLTSAAEAKLLAFSDATARAATAHLDCLRLGAEAADPTISASAAESALQAAVSRLLAAPSCGERTAAASAASTADELSVLAAAEAATSASLAALRRDIEAAEALPRAAAEAASARLHSLEARRAALLSELAAVDASLSGARKEAATAAAATSSASARFRPRAAALESAHAGAARALARAAAPGKVVNSARALGMQLAALTRDAATAAAATPATPAPSPPSAAAEEMAALRAVRAHLEAQERLLWALSDRCASAGRSAGAFSKDAAQYRGLGLTALAALRMASAEECARAAAADDAAVRRLRSATSSVYTTLTRALVARWRSRELRGAREVGEALPPAAVAELHVLCAVAARCGCGVLATATAAETEHDATADDATVEWGRLAPPLTDDARRTLGSAERAALLLRTTPRPLHVD